MRPYRADVDAILNGSLSRPEALWQVGRQHLAHTNNVLSIAAGDRKVWSHEGGGGSTGVDGVWMEYNPKGVRFERHALLDNDTRVEREVLWSATWEEIVAVVKPHVTGDLLDECRAAAKARTEWYAEEPPCWQSRADETDEDRARREEREQVRRENEDRCYAVADAVWEAARPVEQFALF